MLGWGGAARAETGYSLTVASDDRFRGVSTSDGRAVATLAMSYDDASGFYAGASTTVGPVREEGLRVLRAVQYAGYAHRLPSGLALDIGVTNRLYGRYATLEYGRRFAQAYVGVVGRRVSSYVFFAPDYDGWGGDAAYAEVDALLFERGRWSLNGHLGALRPPAAERYGRVAEVDWRLGLTRRLGRAAISLTWVGANPTGGYRRQGSIVLAASRSF